MSNQLTVLKEPTVLKGWPMRLEGGISVDDRGQLSYFNDLDFSNVKRFYIVSNHKTGFVRAWHGHKKEEKYMLVLKGAAKVGAVKIDDWDKPSKKAEVREFTLSANKPTLLHIYGGWANGFMTLTDDTQVMFFSNKTLDESKDDDYRYDAWYWNIWEITER